MVHTYDSNILSIQKPHLKFQIWDYIASTVFSRIFAEIVIEMAKPIKETPILTGKDAERFVSEMQKLTISVLSSANPIMRS